MKSKFSNAINHIVIALLLFVMVISVGFYFSRPQSIVLANNETAQRILPIVPSENSNDVHQQTGANKPVVPVEKQNIQSEKLVNTKNDITVEVTSAKIINTGVEVGVCYTAPDGGEWYPLPGHLFFGNYEIFPDEYEFTVNIAADGIKTGKRCALVRYRVADLNTLTSPIQFSLLEIDAHGREMYTPCQELQQRLDTNPKAKAYGLKAQCNETADGNTTVTLLGNNSSVATDVARHTLDEIAKAEIVGPWEFTISKLER